MPEVNTNTKKLSVVSQNDYLRKVSEKLTYEVEALKVEVELESLTFPCADCGEPLDAEERDNEVDEDRPRCDRCNDLYLDSLADDPGDFNLEVIDGKVVAIDISEG